MSTNSNGMFARACDRVDGGEVKQITVRYEHEPGTSPRIWVVEVNQTPSKRNTHVIDSEMNAVSWRRYGKSIQNSNSVKDLSFSGGRFRLDIISPEASQCLQAFFEEVKANTSIEKFYFDVGFSTVISPLDVKHFFQNNFKLREVHIGGEHRITPARSVNIATALRDVSLGELIISGMSGLFSNNEVFEQIISACQNVMKLALFNLEENAHYTAVAEMLRGPTSSIQNIALCTLNPSNIDKERAEDELVASLTQNTSLKTFLVQFLLRGEGAGESIKNVLCNTTSIASVCHSNHKLVNICAFSGDNETEFDCEEYLVLNQISNKRKVIQRKLMKYYFSRHVDISSQDQTKNPIRQIANKPLGLLTEILGIGAPEKESAIFNILKCIPELCDVSSRNMLQSTGGCDSEGSSDNKRQKIDI